MRVTPAVFFILPAVARYGQCASGVTCQLVRVPTPFFLAAQRRTASAVKKKLPKENPSKGFSLDSFGNKRAAALLRSREFQICIAFPMGQSSTYFGSTLFLACKYPLVCKKSDDFPAEQQIWKTCPPQGIFALQKSLRGGLRWGKGGLIAENAAPAQRNFQRKFALRRVGSCKFVVLPTTQYSKVREHARFVTLSVPGSSGCQRGRCPSVSEGVQRKPFPRVSFGQFLRGGSTPRFFAQLRSVGSNHQAGRLLPVELWRLRHGKK